MLDISFTNEDFTVQKVDRSTEGEDYFDLILEDSPRTNDLIIRRALETPLAYIGIFILDEFGLDFLDGSFGNSIYFRLSEGLTLNWLAGAKAEIYQALAQVNESVIVKSVELGMFPPDTVAVQVTYSINNEEQTILVPVQL